MPGLDSEKNIVAIPAQPPKQCNSKQTLLVAKLSSSSHLLTVNAKASQRRTQGCTGQRVLPLWTHLSCSFTCLAPASQACLLLSLPQGLCTCALCLEYLPSDTHRAPCDTRCGLSYATFSFCFFVHGTCC